MAMAAYARGYVHTPYWQVSMTLEEMLDDMPKISDIDLRRDDKGHWEN